MSEYMKDIPYANVVGSIMYSMLSTRPDLAYGLSVLSWFMADPGKVHWLALKGMLKYLKRTMELGLLYKRGETDFLLQGYVDSDYAECLDTRKSMSGYISLYMVEQ